MKTKHTPGPWEILKQNHTLRIGHKEPSKWATSGFTWQFVGRPILESKSGAKRGCSPNWYGWPERIEADAKLIASAPELLEALQTIANDCEAILSGDDMSGMTDAEMFSAMLKTVKSAISKATE